VDPLLEEQLKRIQDLTARMQSLNERAAAFSAEIERGYRVSRFGPLADYGDLRSSSVFEPRDSAHDSSPRRRRRRQK